MPDDILRLSARVAIPRDELTLRASRSGGPGGQHVNTSSTRIELVWNVLDSPSLDDATRAHLLTRLASRLDTRGALRLVAQGRAEPAAESGGGHRAFRRDCGEGARCATGTQADEAEPCGRSAPGSKTRSTAPPSSATGARRQTSDEGCARAGVSTSCARWPHRSVCSDSHQEIDGPMRQAPAGCSSRSARQHCSPAPRRTGPRQVPRQSHGPACPSASGVAGSSNRIRTASGSHSTSTPTSRISSSRSAPEMPANST